MSLLLSLLPPVLAAVYTINYARWAWARKLYPGSVGLVLLAVLAIALPGWVLWSLR